MASENKSFFWASYADLMTSLFFVMLTLFILTIILLQNKVVESKTKEKATQAQLDKIEEIEEATERIDPTYFEYKEEYKKHILKIRVNFPISQSSINSIDVATQHELFDAGIAMRDFIADITNQYKDVQYLLIIEGQASLDRSTRNYELSYERALSLKKFWDENGISFGDNCEVLISGSGTGGTMRDVNEKANQRFLIHIVPKPGKVGSDKVTS